MLKTIITFAAFATLAATTIAPAHAFRALNGGGPNGVNVNGWTNGGIMNGWSNGGGSTGFTTNGGGTHGGGNNGAAGGSSTLTIQAIELPAETR
ncbi:MAG: hypothetical protein Q8L19_17395 [Reyranella sp.]|nr:hypothetical protein [Reyranella sp.]